METPDFFNSKINKLRIELPHYSFSHSASGDSSHHFIGRERTQEKLKKIIEDSPNEPGVYLVAGNRGVGKTSLVSEVIKKTSLQTNSNFSKNCRYLIFILFLIAGIQFCLKIFDIFENDYLRVISLLIFTLSFIRLCFSSGYRHKASKQVIVSAIKELSYLVNPHNQDRKTQILKIILAVSFAQIYQFFSICSSTQAFIFYLCVIFAFMFWRFTKDKLREYYIKNRKNKLSEKNIYDVENKWHKRGMNILILLSSLMLLLFLPLMNEMPIVNKLLICAIPFILIFIFAYVWCYKYLKKGVRIKCMQAIFLDSILNLIKNYIKNHNRLYLRMNFGHKLKDEKDILRLIARTLSTEYIKYRHSFWRMLPWRVIAIGFLFLFAYFFSPIIAQQEFYDKLVKETKLYQASSQILLEYPTEEKDKERLDGVFYKIDTIITEIKIKMDKENEIKSKRIKQKPILYTEVGKIGNYLLAIDQLIFEITRIVKKFPKYLWEIKKDPNYGFIHPINYLCILLFISMYLFCTLLFRFSWITYFFVTHRVIIRRLKKLNSDITHSTERETSAGITNYNNGMIGPGIMTKTKKTRNIADAREIEKELQDILNDMQQIPIIMSRPNIVIVFDELDKVESADTSSEKEMPQTKASMFSINSTREKQTEILKILANMKYFLSSVKAKFIFIAGREMYDIHLADVSERNNYIGSIFNAVFYIPSFLTDHPTGTKLLPQESSITSLPEEFVCRRLIPHNYPVESYDLKNYRMYLEKEIYKQNEEQKDNFREEKINKIIAVLQQFIIYLAHLSKGAPKKMMQLFESFVEIHIEDRENENTLFVRRYHNSQHFLSFNYYKQYTLGIIAYLITPIFYRLSESNIKEHSDKLLVSALRFVDFVFKFHKSPFSYKHLDISPEMLEVNRAPELKSVAVDLLNYLTQTHINKSDFSLSEYRFDSLIANEIFAMAKTDDVFSALFSFSLDEMLPLKKHYKDLLERTEKEYRNEETLILPEKYIDAISSLQAVLGDLYYYDDGLEEAEAYYKGSVQAFRINENRKITLEQLYTYIRNMLRLGIIYEKRKQYDFAYLTYDELCKQIFQRRDIVMLFPSLHLNTEKVSSDNYDMLSETMAYEGLKLLYLPFIAKLQILEQSHIGGISYNHLEQLDREFKSITSIFQHEDTKILKADFYSRVADILYYKNSDLKDFKCEACSYYRKALYTLLGRKESDNNSVITLLRESAKQIKENNNMKFCTILARILSDWGNVFFSCDIKKDKKEKNEYKCSTCEVKNYNEMPKGSLNNFLYECMKYIKSGTKDLEPISSKIEQKIEIAFTMYSISLHAYRHVNLHKRSAYQIYKMLCLFKHYKIYDKDHIDTLSKKAIHYLWRANENLNIFELNKRKKDFDKETIDKKDNIPLHYLLVDSEITRIRILVKELELKSDLTLEKLKNYYGLRITSPYRINYSIVGRIYRLRLKSIVNYEAYNMLINKNINEKFDKQLEIIFGEGCNKEAIKIIFGKYFDINEITEITDKEKVEIFENLLAETIYCLIDVTQLLETMDDTYLFPHSFCGSMHKYLYFWMKLYETYEKYIKEKQEIRKYSRIKEYLEKYLDEEWRELISGYRENKKALLHYYKCLEMHSEGKAYHNMIDTMCYVRDDYNDRSDHFNIAEERRLIVNEKIEESIKKLKPCYEDSELYKVENYYEPI